ncbi:hypothetical protein Htur_4122 (plasmid) [Haloterrigena turkmenica DSM 5511]|uniref:Uncharacterized protein n=1 Tax=Haloterrigena turkmenica (strain ATCC 51198 / DSM 5511 / JCM 9101 / NCIMB 13204 / VKM B-1734 / 4k) TaxID=543526 RepID=D2S0Q2_HALTV|nr:hypothetical protein Htur_4122 [Haloterrigena turkmenica DSM 5511]
MHKLFKPLADARPTAHPRVTEAVDPHFESMKPRFDQVSLGIVNLTVQSQSREGSPMAKSIDEKRSLRKIMFLVELMQKRSRRISAVPTKQRDIENQHCLDVYCSV